MKSTVKKGGLFFTGEPLVILVLILYSYASGILAIKTRNIAERCRFLPVRQLVRRGSNANAKYELVFDFHISSYCITRLSRRQ
jgi:hypothetical protein